MQSQMSHLHPVHPYFTDAANLATAICFLPRVTLVISSASSDSTLHHAPTITFATAHLWPLPNYTAC